MAQAKGNTKKRAEWPKREWHKGSGTRVAQEWHTCSDDVGRRRGPIGAIWGAMESSKGVLSSGVGSGYARGRLAGV